MLFAQQAVAVLQQSFARLYGNLLQLEVFDDGARPSLLFKNDGRASTFVEEMTFVFQGPLFIPGSLMGNAWGRGSGTNGKEE